ncbi:DNA cytosine methyltransferase [Chelatococcus sambhunathii]|uniref:DNA cytosine methyltransferase n=1 Tax=Chelatococcus sambhunathii TaxID=363953 RepID=A0ABU1DJI0_9HYPH|nr:hypothetical protein [Chelatococcus sambhunathii]MDR4308266.1 DNA cytosine methyltransferase [Chelatococcus sambhunathii]
MTQPTFLEFFAGGGMARVGLGGGWRCLFANDLSPQKAASYSANFGSDEFWVGNVRAAAPHLPQPHADLACGRLRTGI